MQRSKSADLPTLSDVKTRPKRMRRSSDVPQKIVRIRELEPIVEVPIVEVPTLETPLARRTAGVTVKKRKREERTTSSDGKTESNPLKRSERFHNIAEYYAQRLQALARDSLIPKSVLESLYEAITQADKARAEEGPGVLKRSKRFHNRAERYAQILQGVASRSPQYDPIMLQLYDAINKADSG